jgi:hypothetical protein
MPASAQHSLRFKKFGTAGAYLEKVIDAGRMPPGFIDIWINFTERGNENH